MPQLKTIMNDLLDEALNLADLGVGVIPLWWPENVLTHGTGALRSRGVSVYSLNPWTTLAREGHKFHGA